METESDKPNAYHEGHRFVSHVYGRGSDADLVQITWVPLWAFKHTDGIIAEVKGDDEQPLCVNWVSSHHLGTEI